MAEKTGVNQKELKKLLKSLKQFPVRVQKNVVSGAIRKGAAVVRDEMRTKAPKDTGDLKKSIKIKKRRSPKDTVKFSVKPFGGLNTAKAYWLEYGTSKMPAQPFIRPTLTGVGNRPLEEAKKYFFPRMEKEAKKIGFKA